MILEHKGSFEIYGGWNKSSKFISVHGVGAVFDVFDAGAKVLIFRFVLDLRALFLALWY